MTYKEAEKALWKIGAAHASGDTLRASLAGVIPMACGMRQKTASRFYEYLKGFDSDRAIQDEAVRIMQEPASACFVLWPDIPHVIPPFPPGTVPSRRQFIQAAKAGRISEDSLTAYERYYPNVRNWPTIKQALAR